MVSNELLLALDIFKYIYIYIEREREYLYYTYAHFMLDLHSTPTRSPPNRSLPELGAPAGPIGTHYL
jgi:hypothetical protein